MHRDGDQGEVRVPRVAVGQRCAARIRVSAEGAKARNPLGDLRYLLDVSVEPDPRAHGPNGRGEAQQVVGEDEIEHAGERLWVRFVHRLEDRLSEPLLSLSGEQQSFDELPTLDPGRTKESDDHVAIHDTDCVLAVPDLDEGAHDLVGARPAQVDGGSQQRAGEL